MLSKKFKSVKCKTSLKLAISRIKLLKNKRDIQVKQLRRELAHLLETGQEQTAKIRVEHVIREEKAISGYDLIEIYCELIVARMPIIESQKNCPIDLKEAISSVIFASPRCADIPELTDVRKQFVSKYGKEFVTSALELRPDCGVNRMIVEKLSAKAPETVTKMKVLTAIAKEHNVQWDSEAFEEELLKPKEDLLNGSSSFISTSTMSVASSNANFSANSSQSKSASNIYQTDIPGKVASFHSSSEANLRTTPLAPTPTQNDSTESDVKTSTLDVKGSYQREEAVSLKQPNWRMEFKDAASAAQEAAKSAERASMAARAAAELAIRGNMSRHNSNDPNGSSFLSFRDERPKRSESSKLKGQISDSINLKYDQVEGFQDMNEEAHMFSTDESREETSYHASISDADNARTFDGFRESFSRMEMKNKRKPNEAESVDKNVELNYGKSDSAIDNGTSDDDSIWSPPTFEKHQTVNHDNFAPNIHEIDNGEKLFRDDTKERDARDYLDAVFDEYDPEPTEDNENLRDSFSKKRNDLPLSFAPSTSSVNSSIFSSSHHEIDPFTVEKVTSSKFDENIPVAFDDSDGLNSESDDDISGSRPNETVQNISLPHEGGIDWVLNTGEELQPMHSAKAKSLPGTEEKNQIHTLSSYVGADDPETPDKVADRGDFGLNFGRLTGGLRNRGYSHPPYTASSLVDSPVSSSETLSSTTSRTKQIISPLDKPFTIEKDQSSPIMPVASFILQSDKSEGSLLEEYNQGSRSNKAMSSDKSEEDTTGTSVKQPFFNQEKSRRFRGGNPIPSRRVPYDSNSNASEFLAASEVINQKIYDEKPRTKVNNQLSSRMSKTAYNYEGGVEERDSLLSIESQSNTNSNTSFKLSRRTKDFPSKVQTNPPGSSEFSDVSSPAPELPSQIVDKATIIKGKQNRKSSKPNSSSESMPESSLHEGNMKNADGISGPDTNALSSVKNKSSDSAGRGTNIQETASQKASHVHPKLPNYETFAAHFQSLKANPR